MRRLINRLRDLYTNQSGQSLVVVVIMMPVLIGMCAMAIDVSNWYASRHKAQVAADAAALAAANCIARGSCTTSSAPTVGVTYAADNGFTIQPSAVNTSTAGQVKVTVSGQVHGIFSGLFGLNTVQVTSNAAASYKGAAQICPTAAPTTAAGIDCMAVFAFDSGCTNKTQGFYNNGNSTIVTGIVYSNGAAYNNGNNGAGEFPDPAYYGSACTAPTSGSSRSDEFTTVYPDQSNMPYPEDYSGKDPASQYDFTPPACTTTWTGNQTYTSADGSGVFCDPTGTITVGANAPTGGATFIAEYVNDNDGDTVSPYNYPTNQLAIYQTVGTWTGTSCTSNSTTQLVIGSTLTGTVFAPCSPIVFDGNNSQLSYAFLEGYDVTLEGNQLAGTGPNTSGGSAITVMTSDLLDG